MGNTAASTSVMNLASEEDDTRDEIPDPTPMPTPLRYVCGKIPTVDKLLYNQT